MTWDDELFAATSRLSKAWEAVSARDRDLAALFKVEADMHDGGSGASTSVELRICSPDARGEEARDLRGSARASGR